MVFGRKKKEEFKKIDMGDAESQDLEELREPQGESYDEAELPPLPSLPAQKQKMTDEEEIEMLKHQISKREKELEERKTKETKQTPSLSLTEAMDIIQANMLRNLELLYSVRKSFGV